MFSASVEALMNLGYTVVFDKLSGRDSGAVVNFDNKTVKLAPAKLQSMIFYLRHEEYHILTMGLVGYITLEPWEDLCDAYAADYINSINGLDVHELLKIRHESVYNYSLPS